MDREHRYRTRDLRSPVSGTYEWFHNGGLALTTPKTTYMGLREECDDYIYGFKEDNPLLITKNDCYYPVLTGERYVLGSLVDRFRNFPIDYQPPPDSVFPSNWVNPDLISYAHAIAARSNPARVDWNVPQALGELKDVGRDFRTLTGALSGVTNLVRTRGETLMNVVRNTKGGGVAAAASRAGSRHLSVTFGLLPLMRDLRELSRLGEIVLNKIKRLDRISSDRPIRSKVRFEDDYVEDVGSLETLHTYNASIKGIRKTLKTRKIWGTCEWSPSLGYALPGTDFDMAQQNRYVNQFADAIGANNFGLAQAVWELIPFSWLHDWFANVSDFIASHNNSLPYSANRMNLMFTLSSQMTWTDLEHPTWLELDKAYRLVHVRKYRVPLDKTLLWLLPLSSLRILGAQEIGILAALYAAN